MEPYCNLIIGSPKLDATSLLKFTALFPSRLLLKSKMFSYCRFNPPRKQPDNREKVQQGGEDEACLAVLNNFYGDGIKWHDVACHHEKPIVCEDTEGHLNFARQTFPNIRIPWTRCIISVSKFLIKNQDFYNFKYGLLFISIYLPNWIFETAPLLNKNPFCVQI